MKQIIKILILYKIVVKMKDQIAYKISNKPMKIIKINSKFLIILLLTKKKL